MQLRINNATFVNGKLVMPDTPVFNHFNAFM